MMLDFSISVPEATRLYFILALWAIALLSTAVATAYYSKDTDCGRKKPESRAETYAMTLVLLFGPVVAYLAILDLRY